MWEKLIIHSLLLISEVECSSSKNERSRKSLHFEHSRRFAALNMFQFFALSTINILLCEVHDRSLERLNSSTMKFQNRTQINLSASLEIRSSFLIISSWNSELRIKNECANVFETRWFDDRMFIEILVDLKIKRSIRNLKYDIKSRQFSFSQAIFLTF